MGRVANLGYTEKRKRSESEFIERETDRKRIVESKREQINSERERMGEMTQ